VPAFVATDFAGLKVLMRKVVAAAGRDRRTDIHIRCASRKVAESVNVVIATTAAELSIKTIVHQQLPISQRLSRGGIEHPPGASAYALLGVFVSRRNLERVFGQTVADMRQDCIEAIAAKKPWRYRAAWFRGHLSIAFTVFAFLSASMVKRFVEIWKAV